MSKSSVEIANCRAYALLRTLYETRGQRIEELAAICEKLEAEVERLQKGIDAVSALIADSAGVDGLHLNGDVTRWGELLAGGRDEIWLCAFSEAAKAEGGE